MRKRFAVVSGVAALGLALLAIPASASFDRHFRVFEKASFHPTPNEEAFRFKGKLFDPRNRHDRVGRDRGLCKVRPHGALRCRGTYHLNGEIGDFGDIKVGGDLRPGDNTLNVVGGTDDFNWVAGKEVIRDLNQRGTKSLDKFDLVRPGPKMQRHLDKVKAATKRYKHVGVALRDGYLASDHCEEKPGVGAMGYHYINPQLFGDRRIRPLHPEELLYLPTASGGRRLGGVEYARADADQDLSTDSDRPAFYGRRFNGPMAGHFPGQPIHYDLHVWLFQDNPEGVFARYNPEASC